MLPVTYDDVCAALPRVRAILPPTPLHYWPGLADELGCAFHLKHENHQPVGAFKVRGGVNLVSTLNDEERSSGILAVSTGNHGQSLAYAAQRFGVRCSVVVPRGNNPDKNRAIRLWGAELIEQGRDFDEARQYAEQQLIQRRFRYIHSANEPQLIAGVGTMACEILDALPQPDVILVPIGLGSGICGTAIVVKRRSPGTAVIGVQAHGASAVARTWRTGLWHTDAQIATWAEGIATRVPAEMTMQIMRELIDDIVLVDDDELRHAVYLILKHTHNLAEGAGAASVAAALQIRARLRDRTVVGILSGGNLDLSQLPGILARNHVS